MLKNNIILILACILLFLWQALPVPAMFNETTWPLLGCMVVMIMLWMTEAIPIPVTALLPLVLFPILQVDSLKNVASSYAHPIVFLFLGGFFLALALEKSKLHERIARHILQLTGSSLRGVVLGFLIASALLSMFISNTATAIMMLPIAISVLSVLTGNVDISYKNIFAVALMLAIAYGANIGGTATLIGTPPNMVLVGFLEQQYNHQISFLNWMLFGVPFASLMLLVTYLLLVHVSFAVPNVKNEKIKEIITQKLSALGALRTVEKRVLVIFFFVVMGWVFKRYINDFSEAFQLSDTVIAMTGGLLMFIISTGEKDAKPILEWKDTTRIAWGIILLFGGGLALAHQLQASGLIDMVGEELTALTTYDTLLIIAAVAALVLLMTEVMSNVALISIFLPLVAALALSMEKDPLLFMIPATLAASCAFTMPISTPPNAIVFSSGYVHTHQMAKAGIVLNILAIILITMLSHTWMLYVFNITFS